MTPSAMRLVKTANLICTNEAIGGKLIETADIVFPRERSSTESGSDRNAAFRLRSRQGFSYE
jgi:hypothetical protein